MENQISYKTIEQKKKKLILDHHQEFVNLSETNKIAIE